MTKQRNTLKKEIQVAIADLLEIEKSLSGRCEDMKNLLYKECLLAAVETIATNQNTVIYLSYILIKNNDYLMLIGSSKDCKYYTLNGGQFIAPISLTNRPLGTKKIINLEEMEFVDRQGIIHKYFTKKYGTRVFRKISKQGLRVLKEVEKHFLGEKTRAIIDSEELKKKVEMQQLLNDISFQAKTTI